MKKTIKLLSIILLLCLSFIYTNKVAMYVKEKDPIMKSIKNYKTTNDISKNEPVIRNNTIEVGTSGKVVDVKASYSKMKENDKYDEDKIIYKEEKPNKSIKNTFDYFVVKGNNKYKYVYLVFGIKNDKNLNKLINISKEKINYFVDGAFLEDNLDYLFLMNKNVYNMGYNNTYNKKKILITNNLIESVTMNKAMFCITKEKNMEVLDICKKKNMYTILPSLINPSLTKVKESLDKGMIIYYDLDKYNINEYKTLINVIESRGYEINSLKNIIEE